jgi:hypothetical protein
VTRKLSVSLLRFVRRFTLIVLLLPLYSLFRPGRFKLTKGTYSLTQPTIRPLFDTKQLQDVLMSLNGITGKYYDYLRASSANLFVHLGIRFYMMVFMLERLLY